MAYKDPMQTGAPPPRVPRQGGVQTGFGPNPAAGSSMGGSYAPQGPGKYNGPLGGSGGWSPGAPGGSQSPPWMPPMPSNPMFKGGGPFQVSGPPHGVHMPPPSMGPMPGRPTPMIPTESPYVPPPAPWGPYQPPPSPELQWPGAGMPYGNDGRPTQIPSGPYIPGGTPPLSYPYGTDQRVNGQIPGQNPGLVGFEPPGFGQPAPASQPGYPGGDMMSYLRTFLPGWGR